jgi:ABC-type uncharacterized transport system substrate-binding protein
MKFSFERSMAVIFVLITLSLFGWYNMTKPRILVLHSYDKNYPWVRDINVGLARGFKNKYRYQLNWYYMDTKRHPDTKFKQSAGIAAVNFIKNTQPDIVIAIDDDAQEYVAKHFINKPNITIVYAGINSSEEKYGYEKAVNVTGILERLPLKAVQETLASAYNFKSLNRPVRVAFVGDKSATVLGDEQQIQDFNWSPHQLVKHETFKTFSEWQTEIKNLATQADVILVTNYRELHRSASDPQLVPAKEVVAWMETHSPIPIISGNGFYLEDGGMLSIGTSPYEQGEVAAKMALSIALQHKKPSELERVAGEQFVVTMNASKMNARHFELPRVYEAAARTGDSFLP